MVTIGTFLLPAAHLSSHHGKSGYVLCATERLIELISLRVVFLLTLAFTSSAYLATYANTAVPIGTLQHMYIPPSLFFFPFEISTRNNAIGFSVET